MTLDATGERETDRLEAFSDGVFAFAITLLALELKDPTLSGGGPLFSGLVNQWPAFFAFATSFSTVLVMWMNHHNMFNYIKRIDREFMLLNGLLLAFVTLTPFTTSLVANHILSSDHNIAAAVYSGAFFFLSVAWNVLWHHASSEHRLLGKEVTESEVRGITWQYRLSPILYGLAIILSPVNGLGGVMLVLLLAASYALRPSIAG